MAATFFNEMRTLRAVVICFIGVCIRGGPQGTYVYSSFRNRNFWLEYSTPPTTLFPEYDEYNPEPSATPEPGPIFRDASLNHSTLQSPVGSTVFLDCRIADLMDYQVSWFRRQNSSLSVLTIGRETFSADLRYSMELEKSSNNWRLRIRPTMAIDDGTYLCQISTHPPTILVTNLKIIVPRAFLVDEERREISEKHYKPGSTIEFHCVVTNYLNEFKQIVWKHDNRIIDQDSPRGGISVKTSIGNGTVSSFLYLATATANDSGTYTCQLSNLAEAKLTLHILNGEEPAAIQSSRATVVGIPSGSIFLLVVSSILILTSSTGFNRFFLPTSPEKKVERKLRKGRSDSSF